MSAPPRSLTQRLRQHVRQGLERFLLTIVTQSNHQITPALKILWHEGLFLAYRLLAVLRTAAVGEVVAEQQFRTLLARADALLLGCCPTPVLVAQGWTEAACRQLLHPLADLIIPGPLSLPALGRVFEGLLELEPMLDASGRVTVPAGVGRKQSGSYYTPDSLVRFLVERTLGPLVTGRTPEEIVQLRIIDPTVGAGHFLLEATRYLAAAGADRHQVVRSCLFGIDRNPLAVELARAALVLETGTMAPHLAVGDALTDWPQYWKESPGHFTAVLGNPPWEALRPQRTEFFARHGLSSEGALAGYTRRQRMEAEQRLLENSVIAASWRGHLASIAATRNAIDQLYRYQKIKIAGDLAGRYLDLYRVFMERAMQLAGPGGRIGLVVPVAFRTCAGAAGVRRLYLEENTLELCYTFRNQRKLFEAAAGLQFCLVVAERGGPTREVEVAFDLLDCGVAIPTGGLVEGNNLTLSASSPVGSRAPRTACGGRVTYSRELIAATGGPHRTLIQLSGERDVQVLERLLPYTLPLGEHPLFRPLVLRTNPAALNATRDSWRLEATADHCQDDPNEPQRLTDLTHRRLVPLHEKGTFTRYRHRAQEQARYLVHLDRCADRPDLLQQRLYYRLIGRSVIHASEADKAVFTLIPPGGLVSNSAMVEAAPERRSNFQALIALTILNSAVFNYLTRQQVNLNLNLFILRNLRVPTIVGDSGSGQKTSNIGKFLAHAASRLLACDSSFAALWREVLGDNWREARSAWHWPALDESERPRLLAVIDAVVAEAYQMRLEDFAHVLTAQPGAQHQQWAAQSLDLRAELTTIGMDEFARRYDPYQSLVISH